jgi:hypothetical protein
LQARLASNDRPGLAATWLLLGQVKLSQGNAAGAWQPVRESLLSYRDIGDSRGLAIALLATARLLAPQGRTEEASRLVSRSDALVAASGAPLFGAERYVRGLLEDLELPRVDAAADFEAAFEDALATFR